MKTVLLSFFGRSIGLIAVLCCFSFISHATIHVVVSDPNVDPPTELGGHAMTKFPDDGRPGSPFGPGECLYTTVPSPLGGEISFDDCVDKRYFVTSWLTEPGHTYPEGYLYFYHSSHEGMINLPEGTSAFYFYTQANFVGTFSVEVIANDGTSSGSVQVTTSYIGGSPSIPYIGFYSDDPGCTLSSIIITYGESVLRFGMFDFGIAQFPELSNLCQLTGEIRHYLDLIGKGNGSMGRKLDMICDRCTNHPNLSLTSLINSLNYNLNSLPASVEKDAVLTLFDQLKSAVQTGQYDCSEVVVAREEAQHHFRQYDDISNKSDLQVYPNPVDEVLFLNTTLDQVRVYNALGKQTGHFSNVSQIRMDEYDSGIYFIRFEYEGEEKTLKILKH